MEQVVELFGRFRSRQIPLRELTDTLKVFLANHPQAPRQGLGWLDLAQQRQPMPVTDFIQLRADMDFLLRNIAPHLQAEESTLIGKTVAPGRRNEAAPSTSQEDTGTLVAGKAVEEESGTLATRIARPLLVAEAVVTEDAAATRISKSRRVEADAATLVPGQARAVAAAAEATVIAPPVSVPANSASVDIDATRMAETTVVAGNFRQPSTPPASNSPAASEATRIAAPQQKMPHTQRVPPRLPTTPTAPPADTLPANVMQKRPVLAAVAGIAAALMLVGGVALWSSKQSSQPSAPLAIESKQESSPVPQAVEASAPILDQNAVTTNAVTTGVEDSQNQLPAGSDTVMLQLEVVQDSQNPTASLSLQSRAVTERPPSVQPAPVTEAVETLPNDAAGLLKVLQRRIASGRLLPVDDPNSATTALRALIAKAPDSAATSEARTALSQAHLELARLAREKGDLDAAQIHLDNAFEVRLMK